MTTRNLAKSLHTVTALVNVAKYLDIQQAAGASAFRYANVRELVEHAALVLGLYGMPDVYGLKEKAAAQLAPTHKPAAAPRAVQYSPDNMSARAVSLAGNQKPGEALAEELARNPLRAFQ